MKINFTVTRLVSYPNVNMTERLYLYRRRWSLPHPHWWGQNKDKEHMRNSCFSLILSHEKEPSSLTIIAIYSFKTCRYWWLGLCLHMDFWHTNAANPYTKVLCKNSFGNITAIINVLQIPKCEQKMWRIKITLLLPLILKASYFREEYRFWCCTKEPF